jgi:hypothetical protein
MHELYSFFNAETLKIFIFLLFNRFFKREISDSLAEGVHFSQWYILVYCIGECDIDSFNKVLVLLIYHLVENVRETCGRIECLFHQYNVLTYNYYTIQLTWDEREVLLIEA